MAQNIFSTRLPNPDSGSDPEWREWDTFIGREGIPTCDEEVVRCYQNLEERPHYLASNWLNHQLNLQNHGKGGAYATLAEDQYGVDDDEEEYPANATTQALENVFSMKSCRFTADSVVFKGVHTEPFYEIHSFGSVEQDAVIEFPGFLSTSVCREKALDFAHRDGVLLVIQGLDQVDCIVPQNSSIRTTKNAKVPEQEVLLRRGAKMCVERVVPKSTSGPREVHLRIVGALPN